MFIPRSGRRARQDALPEVGPVDVLATVREIMAVDPSACDLFDSSDRDRLLARLGRLDEVMAALQGEVNRTIAALSPTTARTRRSEDAVVDEICAARRVGAYTAARMLQTARLCATSDAPGAVLQDALLAGVVSAVHVDRFVAETAAVRDDILSPTEATAGVVARTRGDKLARIAVSTLRSARLDTASQYRYTLQAAVARVDGAAQAERRRAAEARREVFASRRQDDPLAALVLTNSPEVVARLMAGIQARGRRLQLSRGGAKAARSNPDARIGPCRADALTDLIETALAGDPALPQGCASGPLPEGTQIDLLPPDTGLRPPAREGFLVIDAATLRHEQDHPALLDGTPVPASVGRHYAAGIHKWRRMVTDPVTGHLLDYGQAVYLPKALTAFIRARDGQCIVPYCERPAMRCQVDHGTPYPKGPSAAWNCHLLCDRHHPLKTEGYEHLHIDGANGWVTYQTAWGQLLEACGHSYLPDWDDEPYDVLTQTRPGSPDDNEDEPSATDPDPPPQPAPPVAPDDDPPPF